MIHINLLPVRESERAHYARHQRALAALVVAMTLLVMAVPYTIQGQRLSELEHTTLAVQAEIQRCSARMREVQELDRIKTELQAKLRVIDALRDKRVGPARVLNDLSAATPGELWLQDFKEMNGAATIIGMALDNRAIARFMRQLQASLYFVDVDLVEATQAPAGQGAAGSQSFKRFIINAAIDYFGRDGQPPAPAETAVAQP